MDIFLFVVVYILLGIALIYFYGKLPKAVTAFLSVFFVMSLLYWGTAFVNEL